MPKSGKNVESDKWGWKHVSVHGGFDKGSGTKRWKCNHCNQRYNGSYSRVRAHLLGFPGVGIKSCPEIDKSLRESLLLLDEERLAQKPKKASKTPSQENVDEAIARFFYADGINLNIVNSPYFREMVKVISAFREKYEPPSAEMLSDSSLSKEKARVERAIALIKESWPHTGCTVLCVNHLDCSISCFCINFFVVSPRGVVFLKTMDVNEREEADDMFVSVLSDTINEVGPTNVLQVITHLGQVSFAFESVIVSKFPRVFWSHCASHSISMLMEEIAKMEWINTVLSYAKGIEETIMAYRNNNPINPCPIIQHMKFLPYCTIHRLMGSKKELQEIVVGNQWKQWKLNLPEGYITYENLILDDEFWPRLDSVLQIFEPFATLSSTLETEKTVMGDVYNWRVQFLEALKSKEIDDILLKQLELLIESKWDSLFSPLHATGYILNPKYFGKGQSKDKNVMSGWKATLERYESEREVRRVLREQLSCYWREERSFGDEDAVESRDKMDPVAWWENFGFETPELRTLATKVLSQVSSVSGYEGSWLCKESVMELEVNKTDDLLFVQNNLRLQSRTCRNRNLGCLSLPGNDKFRVCIKHSNIEFE